MSIHKQRKNMKDHNLDFLNQSIDLIDSSKWLLSSIKPSEWNEKYRSLTSDVSPQPGKFSYKYNPYTREIVDCLSPDHPSRIIGIKKGAQIGFSTAVIEAGIGWIMSESPGNILFLTGHGDLAEEAMSGKIDQMIDSCGLRPLIKPNILRKKNQRTGDTNKSKEFPGGSLVAGSASNHKLLRQRSVRYGFVDDVDAAKSASKESGSTLKLIEQRFAAYSDKMKLFYISTPELKNQSNIEEIYNQGDCRKFFIPCPCCGDYIHLEWSTYVKDTTEPAGITWKVDENNAIIKGTVGYICQSCGDFFTDANKYDLNLKGEWRPTKKPIDDGYFSYHLNSLYAPPGMFDWHHYINDWLKIHPVGEKRNEELYKTFINLVLGEPYEQQGEAPKANQLQKNIFPYEIGTIPEKLSINQGNGKIVLLTCACDMNGTVDDARLDYEILAFSESGSSYAIDAGSIGTFIPREGKMKGKTDREKFSYEHNKSNSVWPIFTKIIEQIFVTDTDRKIKIAFTGVDTGHYTNYAYEYIDKSNNFVIGLKGKDQEKYTRFNIDTPLFRHAKERANLYLVEVSLIKDRISDYMSLKYDQFVDDKQPANFMNFPLPADGKYTFNNYFSHYESEHKIVENKDGKSISSRWVKKTTVSQNHFFDVRVYNLALKEIVTAMICKELKIKEFTWNDFVKTILP